jgi:hypothetical protein
VALASEYFPAGQNSVLEMDALSGLREDSQKLPAGHGPAHVSVRYWNWVGEPKLPGLQSAHELPRSPSAALVVEEPGGQE